jgi:hypothetical protein
MPSRKCSKGQIRRNSYTRRTSSGKKVHVKRSCIKATGAKGVRSSSRTRRVVSSMLRRQKRASQLTKGIKECPKGYVLRAAYMRKSADRKSFLRKSGVRVKGSHMKRTVVPSQCIKARGHDEQVGLYDKEGKRIYVVLEKGSLGKHGYKDVATLSENQRHIALDKAIAELNGNWLSVFRKINYLAVLNKYNPSMYKLYVSDRDYIKRKYSR